MKIIKRKDYYYIGHSFRPEGKVAYKERYIGKTIPDNIGEIKEAFMHECINWGFIKKLKLIKKNFQKEWKHYPESIKKKILIDLSISFTYNTNAIEGSTITLEETEDIIKSKIAPNKPLRDVQETINHSKVFFKVLNEKRELSNNLILEWHREVFYETKPDIAGKYRDYLVKVGNYIAPDWQEVNRLMKEFIEWHSKNKSKMNPIELAARAHYKFEKIHPFGDGNGRIGRLIIFFILRKSKYPMFVIEFKKRRTYYKAISKNEHDFVSYFISSYFKAHKKYVN